MIYTWNKELKRQGSASRSSSRRSILDKIEKVSNFEVETITSSDGELSNEKRKIVAKQIDDLYSSFPNQMVDTFHDIYEREVKKKINAYIKSQK